MKMNVQLLIIDPQNDFCDLPESWQPVDPGSGARIAPSLPVAGAHADMQRLAGFLQAGHALLSDITVTLDSHHRVDIAHPTFWTQGDDTPVTPYTRITAAQVRAGLFRPRDAAALPRTLAYLDELEARGRYTLMVWPVHCQIGSWGHNVHAAVQSACSAWEDGRLRPVQYVHKGMNPWTEHYSALQAEVPDAADPATQLDRGLLQRLDGADVLLVAGEASSHCVRATVEHIVEHLPGGRPERLMLLTDCMSAVSGFDRESAGFLQTMQRQGVRLVTAAQALRQLRDA
ncbi:cysteine hydrolase family protein [Bordetella genomosp. 13]|uniref:Cysteine hydrolase n=1 Tax=Bordetella genomosp. 13 TaxID=463040 RepID=A0A1W6ZIY7_9BORD|nr:cysteine hydrolase family protein [Bordetella genomosp. 13]ARP97227.1 cysteine hydrolase [Bordetella genomosp. 13]